MDELWLLRHAPVAAAGRALGWFDEPISADGRQALAQFCRDWRRPLGRIVASDLQRSMQTAEALAARTGAVLLSAPCWREIHFGAADGQTWDAIHTAHPKAMQVWGEHWLTQGLLGGESYLQLIARVAEGLVALGADNGSGPRLIVSHAGPIRAMLALNQGWPPERALAQPIPYLGLRRLRWRAPIAHYWRQWREQFAGAYNDAFTPDPRPHRMAESSSH